MKSIIRIALVLTLSIVNYQLLNAQISINEDGSSPDASAMLDVKSTDKGILIPRMTTSERTNISSPATGLMVYDTDENTFWYYNGTAWSEVGSAGAFITENGFTHSTTNDDDFVFGADSINYNSGNESKFFFNKDKFAFRAGLVNNTNWDVDSLGFNSFGVGLSVKATANYSIAIGTSLEATANFATAFGSFNSATGSYSTVFGNSNEATGDFSTAFGVYTKATETSTTAFGNSTTASGNTSTAFGFFTEAAGDFSTVGGYGNTASSYGEVALGLFNTSYTPNSTSSFDSGDRLFGIGNGTSTSDRSDAFVINKSGNVWLNGALTIDSSYTFPSTDGINGQTLTTDGSGNLTWASSIAGVTSILQDADGDTQIQVEESSDDDIIRFDLGGTEFMRLDSGRMEILNTGGSIILGNNAGENDDYSSNYNVFIGTEAGNKTTTGEYNFFSGYKAGYKNTTGNNNIFFGGFTGENNTTGSNNIFQGFEAGFSNSTGSNNIFLGYSSGWENTTGYSNIFLGQSSGESNKTGYYNVFIGSNSGYANTTGYQNTFIGSGTGQSNTSGDYNVFLGAGSGNKNTSGDANVFLGDYVGYNNTTGDNNVFIGNETGNSNTTGNNNVFIGNEAGKDNTIGEYNVFIGNQAGENETLSNKLYIENSSSSSPLIYGDFDVDSLQINGKLNINGAFNFPTADGSASQILATDGNGTLSWANNTDNQAFDVFILQNDSLLISLENDDQDTYGIDMTTISPLSLSDADDDTKIQVEESSDEDIIRFDLGGTEFMRLDSGRIEILNTGNSIFIGEEAGENDDYTLNYNIFIGYQAGKTNTTGSSNIFIGTKAGTANTTGSSNIFIGPNAGITNTTGYQNTFIGPSAGLSNTTGISNSFYGNSAGYENTTGSNNTFMGYSSGINNESGTKNTFIGYFSGGSNDDGDNNTYLGNYAGGSNDDGDNNTYLGFYAGGASSTGSNNVFIGYEAGRNEINSNKLYIANSSSPTPLIYGDFSKDSLQINGKLNINGSFNFPTSDGINGQTLTTDGSGNLTWVSSIAGVTSIVQDTDGNTQIQVEESTDDDIIRFDIAGTEFMRLDSGRIEIVNTGNSIFIGEEAGYNDDFTGSGNNLFLGYQTGYENTSGYNNVFAGSKSGYENTTGYSNLFLGSSAGRNNTSGYGNIFLGSETGETNDDGQYNVMIGHQAGTSNTSGNKNVFIGYRAGKNATGSNKLYIHNSASSSPLIYGDFSNDSLQINGSLAVTDKITTNSNWISGDGDDEGIFINSDGNIGIGTNTPTQGKLVISGTGDAQSFSGGTYGYWSYNGSATNQSSLSGSYALYTDQRIAAFVYHAISDERVKDIQGISDNATDLETLKKIQVTDYQFKDKVKNGDITQKKVIAQQVAEVYPQAVTNNTTEVVPDIMQSAIIDEQGWISFSNEELGIRNEELKKGDKVQILFENKKELLEVLEINGNKFRVKPPAVYRQPSAVFIYGRQVNDFHTVDYEAISMLNVSATQQLAKEVEQLKIENGALKISNAKLQAQLEKVNRLEATLQQLQAQLENQ